MTIRTKFILALLLTSLASTAVVGGVAYVRLMKKFDSLVLQSASRNFRLDVSNYFRAYGTWENGQKHESFREFAERRGRIAGRPHLLGPNRPSSGKPPKVSDVQVGAISDARTHRPPPDNLHRAPFRFYLFDTQGRSLMNLAPYRKGDPYGESERHRLLPIESDGQVVAFFSPQGKVNYSDLDLGYLTAMREALVFGVIAAATLALLLGLVFGNRLSGALRKLTAAVQAVGDGELKQHVRIDTQDEVGMLARTFNRMSDEIARNHADLRDSHEQIRQQALRLRELSIRDALTGLHNRRFFDEQAQFQYEQAKRYQHPFTVMIGDIDHFKRINDQFSHAMGDDVLRQVAEILRKQVRATDIVARYGGEEFVIAFPQTDLQQAVAVCETLRLKLQDYPWHTLHPDLKVTMSMGLDANLQAGHVENMLTAADNLLYLAKTSGRNQVCSQPGVTQT